MQKKSFTLGIDGSNVRAGGVFNHLVEIIKEADPPSSGIDKVIIWCNRKLFDALPERSWLEKISIPMLDRSIGYRLIWQHFLLPRLLRTKKCDALFSSGGSTPFMGVSVPSIVMSANMLPFEKRERRRYSFFSYGRLRLKLLQIAQSRSFSRGALGIFLTPYAKDYILPLLKCPPKNVAIIPSGIESRFLAKPRVPIMPNEISKSRPFRFLYVSHIDLYKHQWNVATAAAILVKEGFFIRVDFLGSTYSYPPALKKFENTRKQLDSSGDFLHYQAHLPFEALPQVYQQADAFVFASSCENLPSILIEAMASGLPIACSNRGPMPEVIGDAGLTFNPESTAEIAKRMRELILNPALRGDLASHAYQRAQNYSWKYTARQIFSFIGEMLRSPSKIDV